jgi:hypothetical protein
MGHDRSFLRTAGNEAARQVMWLAGAICGAAECDGLSGFFKCFPQLQLPIPEEKPLGGWLSSANIRRPFLAKSLPFARQAGMIPVSFFPGFCRYAPSPASQQAPRQLDSSGNCNVATVVVSQFLVF